MSSSRRRSRRAADLATAARSRHPSSGSMIRLQARARVRSPVLLPHPSSQHVTTPSRSCSHHNLGDKGAVPAHSSVRANRESPGLHIVSPSFFQRQDRLPNPGSSREARSARPTSPISPRLMAARRRALSVLHYTLSSTPRSASSPGEGIAPDRGAGQQLRPHRVGRETYAGSAASLEYGEQSERRLVVRHEAGR